MYVVNTSSGLTIYHYKLTGVVHDIPLSSSPLSSKEPSTSTAPSTSSIPADPESLCKEQDVGEITSSLAKYVITHTEFIQYGVRNAVDTNQQQIGHSYGVYISNCHIPVVQSDDISGIQLILPNQIVLLPTVI